MYKKLYRVCLNINRKKTAAVKKNLTNLITGE